MGCVENANLTSSGFPFLRDKDKAHAVVSQRMPVSSQISASPSPVTHHARQLSVSWLCSLVLPRALQMLLLPPNSLSHLPLLSLHSRDTFMLSHYLVAICLSCRLKSPHVQGHVFFLLHCMPRSNNVLGTWGPSQLFV